MLSSVTASDTSDQSMSAAGDTRTLSPWKRTSCTPFASYTLTSAAGTVHAANMYAGVVLAEFAAGVPCFFPCHHDGYWPAFPPPGWKHSSMVCPFLPTVTQVG